MKRKRGKSNEPTQRQLRVGEGIRHILSDVFSRGYGLSDFLLNNFITVTEVRVSPDLKHAKVYVMSMGGKNLNDVVNELNDRAPLIQSRVAKELTMKFTPRLFFASDLSYDEAEKISKLIRNEHNRSSDRSDSSE